MPAVVPVSGGTVMGILSAMPVFIHVLHSKTHSAKLAHGMRSASFHPHSCDFSHEEFRLLVRVLRLHGSVGHGRRREQLGGNLAAFDDEPSLGKSLASAGSGDGRQFAAGHLVAVAS